MAKVETYTIAVLRNGTYRATAHFKGEWEWWEFAHRRWTLDLGTHLTQARAEFVINEHSVAQDATSVVGRLYYDADAKREISW